MPDALRMEWLVDAAASRRPHHRALIYRNRSWTYAALQAELDRRAACLIADGLAPGAVVCVQESMSDQVIISALACFRAALVFLFLSPRYSPVEVASLTTKAGAARILTSDGAPHPALPSLPARPLTLPGTADPAAVVAAARRSATADAQGIAVLQPTSGTTGGSPKLARLPHISPTWLCATPTWWEEPDGVYYLPRPNAFSPRLLAVILGLGATLVLSDATAPESLEAEMVTHGVTSLWALPPTVQTLVAHPHPPLAGLSLQTIRTSASPLPPSVHDAAVRRYGATMVQDYGSTEGSSMIHTPRGNIPPRSIGKPYPGVMVRLVGADGADVSDGEVGELVVHSPALMHGYVDDPEATAGAIRDGWLFTGDLARRDADGFYYLVGRHALRINVGGFKVAPEEIEAVLLSHPGVQEAAVLPMPDARRGEVVRAIIVRTADGPTSGELRHYCRARLATYKVPRRLEFRESLPRSPLGKVLRHLL